MLIVSATLLASSCRKETLHTTVNGTVADITTLKTIANAKVFLQSTNPDCFSLKFQPLNQMKPLLAMGLWQETYFLLLGTDV